MSKLRQNLAMQNFDYTGLGVSTREDAFGAYDDPEDEFGATSYQDYEQRSPLKTAEREYEFPQLKVQKGNHLERNSLTLKRLQCS